MENFLKVLTEDATLREDFLRQTTPEGAYLVAKPYLDGMEMKDFVQSLIGIAKVMDNAPSEELSETELVTVSGGVNAISNIVFAKAMETFSENF